MIFIIILLVFKILVCAVEVGNGVSAKGNSAWEGT